MTQETVLTPPRPRIWGAWATLGFGLAVVALFFLAQFLTVFVLAAARLATNPEASPGGFSEDLGSIEGLVVSIATVVTGILCVGFIFLIVKLRKGASIPEYLGFQRISPRTLLSVLGIMMPRTLLSVLGIMLAFIVLSDTLTVVIGRPLNPQTNVDMYNTSVWPPLIWTAVILFAPAFEETFFRGFLFAGFRHSILGLVGTVILTSAVWAIFHQQYDLYDITTIFIGGLMLGAVRHKTGSLWAPLAMHAFGNLTASIQVATNMNALFG